MTNILFLTSHIGLGHVTRDFKIYSRILEKRKDINIDWLTAKPAYNHLIKMGMRPLDVSKQLYSFSYMVEDYIENRLLYKPWRLRKYLGVIDHNSKILYSYLSKVNYDYIIADEFWEIIYKWSPLLMDKTIFLTDYIFKPYEASILEMVSSYILNRYFTNVFPGFKKRFFIGLPQDIPRQRTKFLYGEFMEEWLINNFRIVGWIPYVSEKCREMDKSDTKTRLNISTEKIVITLLNGGTKISGISLQKKIILALKRLHQKYRNIYPIFILGPRTPPIKVSEMDIRIIRHTIDPGIYLAASDIVISRAGRTSVTDILYLGKPSILIPLPNHFEQKSIAKIEADRNNYIEFLPDDFSYKDIISKIGKLMSVEGKPLPKKYFIGDKIIARDILKLI